MTEEQLKFEKWWENLEKWRETPLKFEKLLKFEKCRGKPLKYEKCKEL